MIQMSSFISGFDLDSRPHLHSESLQRFIYFIQIEHFTLFAGVLEIQFEFGG